LILRGGKYLVEVFLGHLRRKYKREIFHGEKLRKGILNSEGVQSESKQEKGSRPSRKENRGSWKKSKPRPKVFLQPK